MRLSHIAKDLAPSPTLAVSGRAKQLRAQGIDILDLSLGEPDFATPEPIRIAAQRAIDEGYTKYTPVAGMMEVRQRICQFLREKRSVSYTPEQIVISTGAKQALYNAIFALISPGDEVIIPTPYWVSYPTQVQMAGGRSVFVQTRLENNFQIDPDAVANAITPYTKMIILNSPNNPTGTVYDPERIKAIAQLVDEKGLWLLSDEIYDELVFGDVKAHSPLRLWEPVQPRTILVNGFSKAYAMTGWRLGFMAAPKEVAKACVAIQGASTSGANAVTQRAAIAALDMDPAIIHAMRDTFAKRLQLLLTQCQELPHVRCPNPQGAFYLMLDFSGYRGSRTPQGTTLQSGIDLAGYLLEEGHVALVPGEAFGAPWHIRISYASDEAVLTEAVRRIKQVLAKLQRPSS